MYHDGSLKKKFPGEGKRDGSVVAIKIHETNQISNGNNITHFQIQNEKILGYLDFKSQNSVACFPYLFLINS